MSLFLELKRINKWRQSECAQRSVATKKKKLHMCVFDRSWSTCLISRVSIWPLGGDQSPPPCSSDGNLRKRWIFFQKDTKTEQLIPVSSHASQKSASQSDKHSGNLEISRFIWTVLMFGGGGSGTCSHTHACVWQWSARGGPTRLDLAEGRPARTDLVSSFPGTWISTSC